VTCVVSVHLILAALLVPPSYQTQSLAINAIETHGGEVSSVRDWNGMLEYRVVLGQKAVAVYEALKHAERLGTVRYLDLRYSDVTDKGLAHVGGMRHLRSLNLAYTSTTDAGLARLDGLNKLLYLSLSATRVTDASLGHLKRLPLWALNLTATRVTDKALPHLMTMQSLKLLSLRDTAITKAGLSKLREALPKTQILSDPITGAAGGQQ